LTETKALQAQVLESGRLAALGQLAAEVSHEIKNPLIMIGGFARQLLRSVQEPQSRNKLQIIADEVARLETLIGELRDLYRPRPLELEAVDLRALLEEIHALIRDDSKDRNVEAVLDLPTDPLIVQGDRNKLKQVILNLVRNGIEAMDHGGTLTIRAHCTPERLEISVTDEGGGIPEADREKIFVPFYTTKKHGTGLGLSLSKRIIEEHAGYSFSLTSGQEKGAVARITMPAAVCELPAGGSSPAPKTRKRRKK
jgi:signal transduction histidine kinase